MKEHCVIKLTGPIPIVTAAIHNGHKLSENLSRLTALTEAERFREEDPYTGILAKISKNHIIGQRSRFEYDLNRSHDKAFYLFPSDAWGLNLWKKAPSGDIIGKSMLKYYAFYDEIHDGLTKLIESHGRVIILDFHSYNHRRGGPGAQADNPVMNPEINIGTGTMDRTYWGPVVDRFINDLREADVLGRHLDVRENIKFRGGYFPTWIHSNFKESACCISVAVKKFFMDEWSGKPDWDVIVALMDAFSNTIPGLMKEISKKEVDPHLDYSIL